jgi:hypothetical protein
MRRPGIGAVLVFMGFVYAVGLLIHFWWLFLAVAVVCLVIGVAREQRCRHPVKARQSRG